MIPTRLAPVPPPLPESVKKFSDIIFIKFFKKFLQVKFSNFAKCGYDFSPENKDTNQISIMEGESLKVQQKHDDAGNVEWWLVEKLNGEVGYVPASYLKE